MKVLKPQASVAQDRCAICRAQLAEHGRHAVEYPVVLRDGLVCDDCAHDYPITCQCCQAGRTMDEIIASGEQE